MGIENCYYLEDTIIIQKKGILNFLLSSHIGKQRMGVGAYNSPSR